MPRRSSSSSSTSYFVAPSQIPSPVIPSRYPRHTSPRIRPRIIRPLTPVPTVEPPSYQDINPLSPYLEHRPDAPTCLCLHCAVGHSQSLGDAISTQPYGVLLFLLVAEFLVGLVRRLVQGRIVRRLAWSYDRRNTT